MRWHLTTAVLLASCGLDTSPETTPKGDEPAAVAADSGEADSAARSDRFSWRPRTRFDPVMGDDNTGSTSDAKAAATSGGAKPPASAAVGPQANSSGQSGSSTTAPNASPASGPASAAPNPPAGTSGATGSAPSPMSSAQTPAQATTPTSMMDAGTAAAGANTDANAPMAPGMRDPSPGEPDPATSPDAGPSTGSSGSPGSTSGSQSSASAVTGLVSGIVDLVLAILDLSFGPVRPAEIEQLVSTILVLALAPADLVAESLTAVLTQLEQTRICSDHPERCNPLCQNLESDCSVCGRDRACIDQIEHMCQVQLPDNCH